MPKVSVIVPVYNAEKYIFRCLDCICSQTYTDLEIICVNDGSTDNSQAMLEEYAAKDNRIKIVTQKNQGLSGARNTGLMNANGKYVGFIDPDDWVDENFYETLINLTEQNNADFAMAGMKLVYADGSMTDNTTPNCVTKNFAEKLKCLPFGSVCDKIFSLELFKNNQLMFPQGRLYEDNIVLEKLAFYSGVAVFTNKVSYYYFQNPKGICRSDSDEMRQKRENDRLYMAQEMMAFAKEMQIKGIALKEVKAFTVRTVAIIFLDIKSKYYKEIKQILGRIFVWKIVYKPVLIRLLQKFYRVKPNGKLKVCGITLWRVKEPVNA